MATRRRWVLIAFGVAVLLVFIGIGAIIGVAAWFQQNLQVDTRSAGDADQEFAAIRKQFGERPPLLEMRDGRPQYSAEHGKPAVSTAPIEEVHLLAWDPEHERLARFSAPFWLLRMKSGPLRFGAYASGLDDGVDLRPAEIERYGSGIILDTQTSSGERVLIWAR